VLAEHTFSWDEGMSGHMSRVGLGAALASGAALGLLALDLSLRDGALLVFLLAVLVSARVGGRIAGYAAVVTSVVAAAMLMTQAEAWATPKGIDLAALTLLGGIGAGIAAWIGPRGDAGGRESDSHRVLKEEFLATVSHELRTPLNAILGWTELLRMPRRLPEPQVDRGLEVIERNARRQLALVEDLLAAAEPADSREHWEAIDVRELLQSLLGSLQETAAAASISLEHEAAAPDEADASGPVWVRGDRRGLRLALRHVLDNAVKFTPAGGRVLTRLRRCGDRVQISVTDTGAGIAPATLARVFEPFRQQDSSPTRAHGGLGLGLTVALRLVERHGGQIDVRSGGARGGSTFLVTLPTTSHR
jgi:signal transduction histidine kinase